MTLSTRRMAKHDAPSLIVSWKQDTVLYIEAQDWTRQISELLSSEAKQKKHLSIRSALNALRTRLQAFSYF